MHWAQFPRLKVARHQWPLALDEKQAVSEVQQLLQGQVGDGAFTPMPLIEDQVSDSPRIVWFTHRNVFVHQNVSRKADGLRGNAPQVPMWIIAAGSRADSRCSQRRSIERKENKIQAPRYTNQNIILR